MAAGSADGPVHGSAEPAPAGAGAEGQLLHQLHLEQKRSDALRQQLMEAQHALRRLRTQPPSPSSSPSALVLQDQGRLLKDAQGVVLELREDLLSMQGVNRALKERCESLEAAQSGPDERSQHRRELREQRLKLLRAQQERQRLSDRVLELEASAGSAEADSGRVRALEAALAESRREAATLREQRLTALAREIDGLHPRQAEAAAPASRPDTDTRRLVDALEESEQQLGAAVKELGVLRRRCDELQSRCESQTDALQRRASEYEALLKSRAQELGTIGVLSSSLNDTKELFEQSQMESRELQDEVRRLKDLNVKLERQQSRSPRSTSPRRHDGDARLTTQPAAGSAPENAEVDSLRRELAAVKKTASNAIATLSASLKKALVQAQEQSRGFEMDRTAMREQLRASEERSILADKEAASLRGECTDLHTQLAERDYLIKERDDELRQFRQRLRSHQERTIEAKQRLKAEILGTRELIRNQQTEMLGYDVTVSPSATTPCAELPSPPTADGPLVSPSPRRASPREPPPLGTPGVSPTAGLGGTLRPSERRPLRSTPPRGKRGSPTRQGARGGVGR
eukprot:TRINITY_DN25782_c0_g1_i1.p1 TRINITY_DN25782_c0_g1~~TRINITY_DN25782_c0_g1_i1.p1  ORF type:complete len:594 (+),score=201.02 TRINITY_DN25782_c0_g1_i1:63-1784(+)